ncbi:MAG: PD40 domain-containing protein [Chloroflexi bacterium]|nr:PD40 domain-containing protein [Chloroflexota bacterium]
MRSRVALFVALAAVAAAGGLFSLRPPEARSIGGVATERVSVSSQGAEGDQASLDAAVSEDGRYVAFSSDATLVANDANARDILVHDRLTGVTELADISSAGAQSNRAAFYPDISGDGRYVVFSSDATNLVPADVNDSDDIFVHDRQTGATERISVAINGGDGDADSITPAISADGRYVVFTSRASNLVPNDANNAWDVFLRDLVAGTTELVSLSSDEVPANFSSGWLGAGRARISGNGRYVAFGSIATNLVSDDTNGKDDIFLRDRVAGTTERISAGTNGEQGNGHSTYPDVSDDGRYVVFQSGANTLVPNDGNNASDVFLRDRQAGTLTRASVGPGGIEANGGSQFPRISADGSAVAFESIATNLASGDTNFSSDIFIARLASGAVERIVRAPDGSDGDGASTDAAINGDGTVVVYQSDATNLVAGDTNGATDIFAWGKLLAAPQPTPTRTPTPRPSADVGDVNKNGRVDSIDASIVLQYTAGFLNTINDTADANDDGLVTSVDAALILQYGAGLLDSLPP